MHDTRNADSVTTFEYRISEEPIEHRDKRAGYRLKRGQTHDSGWSVCKYDLSWFEGPPNPADRRTQDVCAREPNGRGRAWR